MSPLGIRRVRLSVMCAVTTVALAGCAIPRPDGSAVIPAPDGAYLHRPARWQHACGCLVHSAQTGRCGG